MLGRTDRLGAHFLAFLWFAACGAGLVSAAQPAAGEPELTLRLRLEWGGGTPKLWSGVLRLSHGSFRDPLLLDIEADSPGSLTLAGTELRVRHRSVREYSGIEVTVTGKPSAKLTVELSADTPNINSPRPQLVELTLQELADGDRRGLRGTPATHPLDSQGNRLLVHRPPSDLLRLEADLPHFIFEPGQTFAAEVLLASPAGSSRRSSVEWEVQPGRGGTAISQGSIARLPEIPTSELRLPIQAPAPLAEGVYTLVLRLRSERRFAPPRPLERRVQFVVLASREAKPPAREPNPPPSPRLVDELDPTLTRRSDLLPRLFRTQIAQGKSQVLSAAQGRLLELEAPGVQADGRTPEEVWTSYRLRVENPGRPHLLEVTYPEDHLQTLGISVVEPNASGRVVPIGLDSGVYTQPGGPAEATGQHTLLFWPRTNAPLVLVTNLRVGHTAVFGRIRLYELTDPNLDDEPTSPKDPSVLGRALRRAADGAVLLAGHATDSATPADAIPAGGASEPAAAEPADLADPATPPAAAAQPGWTASGAPDLQHSATTPTPATPPFSERMIGSYLHKPLFPENFGATEQADRNSERSLDDWLTFWQASRRLVGYTKAQQANVIMMSVLADGSTIYPSSLLEPTPRFDTGAFFSDGLDPKRKDVLELLYRLCDREGLLLIPTLQFTSPLPELERMLESAPAGENGPEGLRLVSADGTISAGGGRNQPPRYNVLDPRTQGAMLRVVEELSQRYARHASFRGVGIVLSAESYAQLPSLEWGYDAATLRRFADETGTALPSDDPAQSRKHLLGPAQSPWVQWRAQGVNRFFDACRAVVAKARPGALLYLAPLHSLAGGDGAEDVYRAVRQGAAVPELLRQRGIDPTLTRDRPDLVWLRTAQFASIDHLPGGALDEELFTSGELDDRFRSPQAPAWLFFHRPYERRLRGFDQVSPWKPAYAWLVAQPLPGGVENRRRFAHALAVSDAQLLLDGGWLIPLGQERTLAPWIHAYRAIPAKPFELLTLNDFAATQPVTFRRHSADGNTWFYCVNDSPWAVTTTLTIAAPTTASFQIVSSAELPDYRALGNAWQVSGQLGAYDLYVVRVNVPNAAVTDVQVHLPDGLSAQLKEELDDLDRRLEGLTLTSQVANPGFEVSSSQAPTHAQDWFPESEGTRLTLDTDKPFGGRRSLRCDGIGAIQSDWFEIAPRPLLGVLVRLRSEPPSARVRLAFNGETSLGPYARSSDVLRAKAGWQNYLFRVFDLPYEDLERLRLRIELLDDAKVWIDDVELVALPLSPLEKNQLIKSKAAAGNAWSNGRYTDCRHLLGGYWVRFVKDNLPAQPLQTSTSQDRQRRILRK